MDIGVVLRNFGGFPETGRGPRACVDLAIEADRLGFPAVWVTDHVVLPEHRRAAYPHNASGSFPYRWDEDIYDPLALMAALATATHTVEIGVAVLVIPYRHPLVVAKSLSTIDQLAGGRVILGAGVGWLFDEFEALGLPEEVFAHRGGVTEDHLRAMKAAWTADGAASYEGRHVRFSGVGTYPRPARRPSIPVWIGGKGDQALRRAARIGDGYLAIASGPVLLAAEVNRLRGLAEAQARDPDELAVALIDGIVVTEQPLGRDRAVLSGNAEQILTDLAAFAAAGLHHLVAGTRRRGESSLAATVEVLEQLSSEVLPDARAL